MKAAIYVILVATLFSLESCSTCYECSEEVIYYDGNNNPIDTGYNTDEFCTADPDQVKDKENDGATCKVQ